MALPYFLGCPAWSESRWVGWLYPPGIPSADYLPRYARLFNSVEGNTTFYAWPSPATVERWAATLPADFRFCAKPPRDISHGADLRAGFEALERFLALMRPLGQRLTPLWLQLPASFGPTRLGELAALLEQVGRPLAVEVRHPGFFDRDDGERALNRLLHGRGVERICLDTRGLFDCRGDDPGVRHAQSWKPRLPVRPTAFSDAPQIRFVGHPELAANDVFLAPWVDKLAGWIEQGRTPHIYLHTPDNLLAPQLALHFHGLLRRRLPGLAELALPAECGGQLTLLPAGDA